MAKSTTLSFRGGSVNPGQGINAGDIHPLIVNRKLQDGTPQQQAYDPLLANQHFDFGRLKFRKNGAVIGSYDPFDSDKNLDLPEDATVRLVSVDAADLNTVLADLLSNDKLPVLQNVGGSTDERYEYSGKNADGDFVFYRITENDIEIQLAVVSHTDGTISYTTFNLNDVVSAIDELPSDEHGYFNSSLYTTPGDGTTTNLVMDSFRISENRDVHGNSIDFVPTHQEDGVDFGEVYLEPGTYILAIQYTLQWVGNPRGTFLPLVTNVIDQPFDFSYEHEDIVRSTRIITRTTRGKVILNIAIDADTPPMGVWVKNLEIVQVASYNQAPVVHDNTLTGTGSLSEPLGVTPTAFGKVKDIPTSINQFRNNDVIPVDGPLGPAKMPASDLQDAILGGPIDEAVQDWLDRHPEATTTVQDGSLTVEKFSDSLEILTVKDYLTPQMFGAKGDGTTDDTDAFRNMFITAKARAITGHSAFTGCYKVYIPCGVYRITDSVIYSAMNVAPASFEIYGSGRDNTIIKYEGETNPLFNNLNIFAFTTFHDIGFIGNGTNAFMALRDSNGYGVQRINFNNCSFSNFCRIMQVLRSTTNLSECTFSWCKIHSCGTAETPCVLFELNCPQLVNWRFIGTDIETFRGTAFYWRDGASVSVSNASIIPMSGCVFKVTSNITGYGFGNYPAIYCNAVRFELHNNSKLLESRSFRKSSMYDIVFYSVFICCGFNLSGALAPDIFIDLVGAMNIEFLYCTGLIYPNIKYESIADNYANPVITLKGCRDVIPVNWLTHSMISLTYGQSRNAPEIIIDNRYDFFLNTGSFLAIFGSREVQVTFFYAILGYLDIYAADRGIEDEQYIIGYARVLRYSIKKRTDYGAVNLTISVLNNDVVIGTAQVALSSGGSGEIPLDIFALKLKVKITNDANMLIQCHGTCRIVS